jgi:divalent metal cation (Fe/Co/Zn/Cd) transporter
VKESEDIRSLQLTLGLYLLIFAMKLAAYFITNILALLAEALQFSTCLMLIPSSFFIGYSPPLKKRL